MAEIALRRKRKSKPFRAVCNFARKLIGMRRGPQRRGERLVLQQRFVSRLATSRTAKNADDHESERCAYIRRHPLKTVVATASAPCGHMLAACLHMGSGLRVCNHPRH
jgi:hypothetical protein